MRNGIRITGTFDEQEDRIKLAILDDEQRPLALWLTQRLANRLVRTLVDLLEKDGPAPEEPKERSSHQLLQQASADLRMGRPKPVEAPPETVLGLITTVNIQKAGANFRIALQCGEDEGAALPLNATALRQFLRVFHELYVQAQWHRDGVWPAWFEDDAHKAGLQPSQVN